MRLYGTKLDVDLSKVTAVSDITERTCRGGYSFDFLMDNKPYYYAAWECKLNTLKKIHKRLKRHESKNI